ncbi:MAG: hypothetical protein JST58_10430 [Bacteroidetes bacterium]|nr:hypothetical protein [Bacteroidota bacterium]
MKARKFSLAAICLIAFSFILSSCYREEVSVNLDKARKQIIPIEQAKEYQQRWLASKKEVERFLTDTASQKKKLIFDNAETFSRDVIGLLLNQKGADSLRIYFGENDKGEVKLVLLPVDKDGHDIVSSLIANSAAIKVPGVSNANASTSGDAGETGTPCPPCTISN